MKVSKASSLSIFLVMAVAVLLAGAVSCGGGDDGTPSTAATSPPAATAASGPGAIALSSTAIQGRSGKILLVYAAPAGGGQQLARLCAGIDSDNFTLSATVMTDVPSGNDPCGGNTSQTTFPQGTYEVTAAVFTGGQQTPEAQVKFNVEVKGNVTSQINGTALSK
jgi:hypothetical protein